MMLVNVKFEIGFSFHHDFRGQFLASRSQKQQE